MAKKSNTLIVPANASDASGMIAAATSIWTGVGKLLNTRNSSHMTYIYIYLYLWIRIFVFTVSSVSISKGLGCSAAGLATPGIMKQLGDNSPVVADFPPADGSNSTFGKEYVESGEGAKQD